MGTLGPTGRKLEYYCPFASSKGARVRCYEEECRCWDDTNNECGVKKNLDSVYLRLDGTNSMTGNLNAINVILDTLTERTTDQGIEIDSKYLFPTVDITKCRLGKSNRRFYTFWGYYSRIDHLLADDTFTLDTGCRQDSVFGTLLLPAGGSALQYSIKYDAVADIIYVHDGTAWKAH